MCIEHLVSAPAGSNDVGCKSCIAERSPGSIIPAGISFHGSQLLGVIVITEPPARAVTGHDFPPLATRVVEAETVAELGVRCVAGCKEKTRL